ncbi:MAG TPA: hypothetical protein VGF82_27040 [Terracidiphilus sp.]|jgi:hypothetical protein
MLSIPNWPAIRRREIFPIAALLVLLFLAVNWSLRAFAADDSYIGLRIASHLATTGHAWFNSGERVMAGSSPLWIVVVALCVRLFGESPLIFPVLNAVLLALVWALLSLILINSLKTTDAKKRALIYVLALIVTIGLLGYASVGQMETALAICLLLAGVAAYCSGSQWALSFLVLAAFTRYEMVVACFIFLILSIVLRQLRPRAVIAAAAVGALGTAFLLAQYHTVIPNTVRAKAAGYSVTHFYMAMNLIWDGPVSAKLFAFISIGWFVLILSLALVLLDLTSATRAHLRDHWPIYTTFAVGLGIALSYFAHPTLLFFWYRPLYTFPIVAFILFCALQKPRSPYPLLLVLFLAVWSYHFWMLVAGLAAGRPSVSPDFNEVARVHRYLTVGRVLNTACPDSSFLTAELGGLGQSFRGNIIDGFGLASPEAIQFQPLKVPEERPNGYIGGFSAGIVNLSRPDIIVSYDIFALSFMRSPLVNDYDKVQIPNFNQDDRAIATDSTVFGQPASLYVFFRKSGTCHPDSRTLALLTE